MDKQAEKISSQCASRPLRVLLVEDSVLVRDLIIGTLCDVPGIVFSGYADTERDAFEKLSKFAYDVVILDIELKQGNGMNLLRMLAQSHVQPSNFKIIFSNNVSDAYRRAGKEYGVQHFFDKSFEFPELCFLLEKMAADTHVE